MKKVLFITLIVLLHYQSFSQGMANNWAFGDSVGLNFSSGEPVFFETAIKCFEACASISDKSGNLLFYTNGEYVWNADHEVMPNGDSLFINGLPGEFYVEGGGATCSETQGVIILLDPSAANTYFIFYFGKTGILYSKVNMELDGGNGDIEMKNVTLSLYVANGYFEKQTAVKHANGRDWWLVYYGVNPNPDDGDSLYFIKYLITPIEIEGPFIEFSGLLYHDYDGLLHIGQMKFSPDGSKLICTRGKHLDIYDFDRCTGEFSNLYTIEDVDENYLYGCEFSSDNSKIYVANVGGNADAFLYQFCLNCEVEITYTKSLIYQSNGGGAAGGKTIDQMQISPNGKIYLPMRYSGINYYDSIKQNLYLSVINSPNELGLECNLDTLSIGQMGHINSYALPNIPNYNLGALAGSDCDTLVAIENIEIKKENISIYPNPASDYLYFKSIKPFIGVLKIYSLDGKLIFSKEINQFSEINLTSFSSGMYFIEITDKNKILFYDKILINH